MDDSGSAALNLFWQALMSSDDARSAVLRSGSVEQVKKIFDEKNGITELLIDQYGDKMGATRADHIAREWVMIRDQDPTSPDFRAFLLHFGDCPTCC